MKFLSILQRCTPFCTDQDHILSFALVTIIFDTISWTFEINYKASHHKKWNTKRRKSKNHTPYDTTITSVKYGSPIRSRIHRWILFLSNHPSSILVQKNFPILKTDGIIILYKF